MWQGPTAQTSTKCCVPSAAQSAVQGDQCAACPIRLSYPPTHLPASAKALCAPYSKLPQPAITVWDTEETLLRRRVLGAAPLNLGTSRPLNLFTSGNPGQRHYASSTTTTLGRLPPGPLFTSFPLGPQPAPPLRPRPPVALTIAPARQFPGHLRAPLRRPSGRDRPCPSSRLSFEILLYPTRLRWPTRLSPPHAARRRPRRPTTSIDPSPVAPRTIIWHTDLRPPTQSLRAA